MGRREGRKDGQTKEERWQGGMNDKSERRRQALHGGLTEQGVIDLLLCDVKNERHGKGAGDRLPSASSTAKHNFIYYTTNTTDN